MKTSGILFATFIILKLQFTDQFKKIDFPFPLGKQFLGRCTLIKSLLGLNNDDFVKSTLNLSTVSLDLVYYGGKKKYSITDRSRDFSMSWRYNASLPAVVFIHGFRDDTTSGSVRQVTNSLISRGDVNVLVLDTGRIIRLFYLYSSTNVKFIGEAVGSYMARLVEDSKVRADQIHLVGHSLGAQIAGFAGKTFLRETGTLVGRISGLDPAGPCFAGAKNDQRLQKQDAAFVDIIHTNDGVNGLRGAIGHVDFYPNGGAHQPGCLDPVCSHYRAWEFFAETVNFPRSMPGVSCRSWTSFLLGLCKRGGVQHMGYGASPDARGLYFLRTWSENPFGLKTEGRTFHRPTIKEIVGVLVHNVMGRIFG